MPLAGRAEVIEFGLAIGRDVSDVEAQGEGLLDARLGYLGVYWRETLSPGLNGSITLAQTTLSIPNRTFAADLDPIGYLLGIRFDGAWPLNDALAVVYAAGYRYIQADDENDTQSVSWTYNELETELGLRVALGERLGITAAGYWAGISGEEKARGTENHTVDLDYDESVGAQVRIDYATDASGRVGFVLTTGPRETYRLYFARNFQM